LLQGEHTVVMQAFTKGSSIHVAARKH
jgi:hypothetical protein